MSVGLVQHFGCKKTENKTNSYKIQVYQIKNSNHKWEEKNGVNKWEMVRMTWFIFWICICINIHFIKSGIQVKKDLLIYKLVKQNCT